MAERVWLGHPSSQRLSSVISDRPPPLASYGYDAAGRLIGIAHERDRRRVGRADVPEERPARGEFAMPGQIHQNGVSETLSYDSANQLLSRVHSSSSGCTAIGGSGYTLDTTGLRTGEKHRRLVGVLDRSEATWGAAPRSREAASSQTFADGTTPTRVYGYDNTDQVISANYGGGQSDSYAYDPMGNRNSATTAVSGVTTSYTSNSANQYTTISGTVAPVHDANGNLTHWNNLTYTWDSENRLLSVAPNAPAVGSKSLVYSYDALHRRTMRVIMDWDGSNWINLETTRFIYDGWNVIEEYQGIKPTGLTLTRAFTWGTDLSGSLQGAGGVGGLLMAEEMTGPLAGAYHYHYDGNGNVTTITDDTGATAATYRYDAFGNTLQATGTYAATNRYQFSTKPLDDSVAGSPLHYYGYRYYIAPLGRWPSRDPIEEGGGLNLYGFVGNDGVDWVDFLGLVTCTYSMQIASTSSKVGDPVVIIGSATDVIGSGTADTEAEAMAIAREKFLEDYARKRPTVNVGPGKRLWQSELKISCPKNKPCKPGKPELPTLG